jgi:hypothetical protein
VPSQPALDVFGIQLIPEEGLEMTMSTAASVIQMVAGGTQAAAAPLHLIPLFNALGQPMGVGASAAEGGPNLGKAAESGASALKIIGEILSLGASLSGKMGSYFRRQPLPGDRRAGGESGHHRDNQLTHSPNGRKSLPMPGSARPYSTG